MAGAKVVLEVTEGPLRGRSFTFEEHDTFIFGRHEDCHAHLSPDDTTASRHHFLLEANPPGARIRDLGSLNGTYVNGVKHGGREQNETAEEGKGRRFAEVDLKHGDLIKVGATLLTVRVEGANACVSCGTAIPDVFKSLCAWEGGSLICPSCRENAAAGHAATTDLSARCAECGRDVSSELGGRRGGAYVCEACRSKAKDDPATVLQHALAQQSRQLGLAASDDVAGYRLGKQLGIGGQGAVYLAERIADGQQVALKVMLAKVAVDEQARRGFQREIEVLKGLRHPNIVGLIEHGSAGGAFYFVMELCKGGSLQDLLQENRRPLRVEQAAPLMLEMLDGLAHAHEQGYVHRDLKPANILLDQDGRGAKVSDFGFAKSFDKAGLSGYTQTGSTAGTFPFMPREQLINFKFVKPVSDVWSIGATFYYALTAALPRDPQPGRDAIDVVLENRVVPIRERDDRIPEALAAVIDRSLAPRSQDRYPTAGEFRAALAKVL